jgi:mevalonate kinase
LTEACAPAKVILLGEHSVVYGRPALAVPVQDVQACVRVESVDRPGVTVCAMELGCTWELSCAPEEEPLCMTVRNTLSRLQVDARELALRLTIRSSIPVASGLGSGAAVATALVRALSVHLGHSLGAEAVSALVYETEKVFHGTPSGIDNTVVAYEQAVCFCRGEPIRRLAIACPFWLAIADSGLPSLTVESVADVRAAWKRDPVGFEALFDEIGAIVERAYSALEGGEIALLGPLMNANQEALRRLGVSGPELEALIEAALRAGASGAKLSGGGRGGNVIAVVQPEEAEGVRRALLAAGATHVIVTRVG